MMQFIQTTCTQKSFLINCPRPCSQTHRHITEFYTAQFWHWDLSEIITPSGALRPVPTACAVTQVTSKSASLCGWYRLGLWSVQLGGFWQNKNKNKNVLLGRELHFCGEYRGAGFEGKSKSSDGQALKAFQETSDVQGNNYRVVLNWVVRRKMLLARITWK